MQQPIKTLLIDDEFLALELLENYIGQVADLEIVGRLDSAVTAIDFLAENEVDLMFLDIQMPQLTGTRLLSVLKNPPATIFTTAYEQYAVDAFAFDATDYLLKPFGFERFLQAVEKARMSLRTPSETASSPDVIVFRADGRLHRLPIAEILFVEGMKEYVRITTKENRHMAFIRLHQIEAMLPITHFIRVHRSFIISANQVEYLEGNRLKIGVHQIPISRNLKPQVIARLFPQ